MDNRPFYYISSWEHWQFEYFILPLAYIYIDSSVLASSWAIRQKTSTDDNDDADDDDAANDDGDEDLILVCVAADTTQASPLRNCTES